MHLIGCEIGDEGVASLVADLGKDDFKALTTLALRFNRINDAGYAMLASAINNGAMPKLDELLLEESDSDELSDEARQAVGAAFHARLAARSRVGTFNGNAIGVSAGIEYDDW